MAKLFQRLGINDCHKCGESGLWLTEYENTMSRLSKNGEIIDSYQEDYTIRLVCPHCAEEYTNIGKKGNSYYIKSSLQPIPKIMKDFNPFNS